MWKRIAIPGQPERLNPLAAAVAKPLRFSMTLRPVVRTKNVFITRRIAIRAGAYFVAKAAVSLSAIPYPVPSIQITNRGVK